MSTRHTNTGSNCITLDKRYILINIFSYFIKKYILGTHCNGFSEAIQMSTHNISFPGKTKKIQYIFDGKKVLPMVVAANFSSSDITLATINGKGR